MFISKTPKVFLTLLFCVCIALLPACSSGAPSPQSEPSASQSTGQEPASTPSADNAQIEPCEVIYWHAMSGSRGEALEQYVQQYNDTVGKELGITVITVFQGNEIASKVRMASQESNLNNMPDIAQTVGMDIPSISKLPMVAPAENFINSSNSKIKKDDIYEHFLRAFTYEDVLVGMPMNCSSLLLHYNADLLREAGFDGPPKTVAELAEYTEKLTAREGSKITRYGLTVGFERYQLVNFCTSQGSLFGDNEGGRSGPMTRVIIDEDGTLEKFLTEWQKVVATGGLKMVVNKATQELPDMIAYYEKNPQDLNAINQIRDGNPLSQEPFDNVNWGGETYNAIIDIMQRFGDGKMTVEQARDEIVTEYNEYLAEYHRVNG